MNIKGTQITAIVFFTITVVLIWQIFNVYPEIGILQDKIKAQETVTEDSEDTLKRLTEFIDFIGKNKETIGKFDSILPADEEKANLLSNMDNIASANGLETLRIVFEEKIDPGSEYLNAEGIAPKKYDFDSRSVKMSLRGSYLSFKNFLNAIEKNLRIADIVSVDFLTDSAVSETEEEIKAYSYNVELKTYLYKPPEEENIAKLLSGGKFKSFTAKSLGFIKEKAFSDLLLSSDYNVNTGADEIGNHSIF